MTTKVGSNPTSQIVNRSFEGQTLRFTVTFSPTGAHQITATLRRGQSPAVQIPISNFPPLDTNALKAPMAAQQMIVTFLKNQPISLLQNSVVFLPATPLTTYNALKATPPNQDPTARAILQIALSRLTPLAQAYETASHSSDLEAHAKACLELANGYYLLGQPHAALGCYHELLALGKELSRTQKDRYGEGAACASLGVAYQELGEVQRAIRYYEQALEIKRQTGDKSGEGRTLNNLGSAMKELREVQRAIPYYEQALKIFRRTGERLAEGQTLLSLGIAHQDLGELRRAISYDEQALEIFQQAGNKKSEGAALNNLGEAHRNLGNFSLACELYKKAIAIFVDLQRVTPSEDLQQMIASLELSYKVASGSTV